jgi:antitoxin (DNA-binding transcriptional repressor) of toxin-antitoxin stability system
LSCDVSRDGQRLLVVRRARPVTTSKINVIANWSQELKQPGAGHRWRKRLPKSFQHGYYGHVMKTVNIADLKNRLSRHLRDVRAGQEILIRDRQAPVARIVPITRDASDDEELHALAARGKIRLGGRPIEESFWNLPAPRVRANVLKRALERERDEA